MEFIIAIGIIICILICGIWLIQKYYKDKDEQIYIILAFFILIIILVLAAVINFIRQNYYWCVHFAMRI